VRQPRPMRLHWRRTTPRLSCGAQDASFSHEN